MLRLRLRTEPDWTPLVSGAAVLTLPPAAPLVFSARAQAERLFAQLQQGVEAVTLAGAVIQELPDIDSEDGRKGVQESLFALCLAELAILDWRNVGDDDGVDLPFDRQHVRHLMSHAGAAQAFLVNYLHPLNQVVTEGNG